MGENLWGNECQRDKAKDPILMEAWNNALIYGPETELGKHARDLLRKNFGEDQVTLAEDTRAAAQVMRQRR